MLKVRKKWGKKSCEAKEVRTERLPWSEIGRKRNEPAIPKKAWAGRNGSEDVMEPVAHFSFFEEDYSFCFIPFHSVTVHVSVIYPFIFPSDKDLFIC